MNYAFDTGSETALLTELAQGVVELLRPLVYVEPAPETGRGPYLKTLRQLPWDPDDKILTEHLGELVGPLPAALVVLGDGEVESNVPQLLRWKFEFRVHLLSGYAGHWIKGRMDSAAEDTREDPGLRVMAQHVIEELHSRTIATTPASQRIRVTGLRYGAATPAWAWWIVTAEVRVEQAICLPGSRGAQPVQAVDVHHNVARRGTMAHQRKTLF